MLSFPEFLATLGVFSLAALTTAMIGFQGKIDLKSARRELDKKLEDAKREAEEILRDARSRMDEVKKMAQEENQHMELQLKKTETLLETKEGFLQKKHQKCSEIQHLLDEEKAFVLRLKSDLQSLKKKEDEALLNVTGMSKEDVKTLLIDSYRNEILSQKDAKIMKYEEGIRDHARRRAQEILLESIQRYSAPTSVEASSCTVTVSRDEIKGFLLGKDGTNIQYFEEIAEVDVIFNDLPKTIHVSAFNLVKRNIAARALEKLVKKRSPLSKEIIQKTLEEAQKEIDGIIIETGKGVAKVLALKNTPVDFLRIMGRLNYRTSYGQNILKHSFEVAALATIIAHELGADVETCRLAAFFHDIGKAIDYEVEGAHDDLSKQILEQYGFSPEIVYAAYAHHDKVPANTIPSMIVKAADAISACRPGARQESLQKYLERVEALEETALSFEGVQKSYALSAGREVRVIVDPEKVDDVCTASLAKDIANKIQHDLTYPGKIKVNVIRKTRAIDYAQ